MKSNAKSLRTNPSIVEWQDRAFTLPQHLIKLPGGRWAVWRCVGLRGAGFAASQVLELATSECAKIADRLVQAQDERTHARHAAQNALQRELGAITAKTEHRRSLKKVLRRVSKDKLPAPVAFAYDSRAAVDAFCQAHLAADAVQADLEQAFAAAVEHISDVIYQVAQVDRFREAVTWQNHHALLTGVNPILCQPAETRSRGSKQRQREELVANYLQRYCVKNDTIGFFGPVGWARFVSQRPALVVRPGPDFLASRAVYFEGWCIDALAEALERNAALRPWIAPRRSPTIYQDRMMLYRPLKGWLEISAGQAAVLQACDGDQMAREIALRLIHTPALEFESETEVYDVLEQLDDMGLIVWALEIPFETYPEQALRRLLERIGDDHLRRSSLRALEVLEKGRSAIALAAGDAGKLGQAMGVMNQVFTSLTGASPSRAAGKTYAARTVVYEDCRRDIEVEVGPKILAALGPPLSLLLDSAHWFTLEAAAIYRQITQQLYAELVTQIGSHLVPMANVWSRLQPFTYVKQNHPLDSLVDAFQQRWAGLLAIPLGVQHVKYSSETLRPLIRAAFGTSRSDGSFACYHTPDVMIAAPSAQAICRGDYQLVMGELHMALNTLGAAFFPAQHPSPEELYQALASDWPTPRVVPRLPKKWPELTTRTHPVFALPHDFRLVFDDNTPGSSQGRTLPIGDMVVEDLNGELLVRTRDGRLGFDIVEFLADLIASQVVDRFKIFRPAPHTPRVTVDRLVIGRETWRFSAEALPFAYEKNEVHRFVAFRRWMRACGMPRFVFAKTPIERKPFYVDFDSPILVNMLAKHVRRTQDQGSGDATISVTEMLPDPLQIWLPDAEDRHYTSEFRIVVLDADQAISNW